MSQQMLSDICDATFFNNMSGMFTLSSPISGFLADYSDELALHMKVYFNKLPVMEDLPKIYGTQLYKLVVARYGKSLERIAVALNQVYNPLHNYDMHEDVTNDGEDNHEYGGSDTTDVTNAEQHTDYTSTVNSSLTSGSTYDDTTVANMKPISKTEHQLNTDTDVKGSSSSEIGYGKTLKMEYGRTIATDRSGNIGTMPTQKLLEMEYYTRMRLTLFDAVVRACCNSLGSGVWSDD